MKIERLKEILDEDGIHTYSTPKGEDYFRKAVALRMKNRFGVELDPDKEIYSLVGSKEGIANLIRGLCNPTTIEKEKDIILKHMWPVTIAFPNSMEGFILTFVDKYCAMNETFEVLKTRFFLKKSLRYIYTFASMISIHI